MAKILLGKVVSQKTPKTLIVEIESRRSHPVYKKMVKKTKRYKVHWEKGEVKIGDWVKIRQTRPLSTEKHFKLLEVLKS